MLVIHYSSLETDWGQVHIAVRDGKLLASSLFAAKREEFLKKLTERANLQLDASHQHTDQYRRWLTEYMNGCLKIFNLPVDPQGTQFQTRVWKVMRGIPPGQTMSYGEIARALEKPGAARAVGNAASDNPVPIFIPCHRVVRSDGSLGGFGGGQKMKQRMLEHEGHCSR